MREHFAIAFLCSFENITLVSMPDAGECDAQFGWTPLIRAAGNSNAECVRLLLDAGADKEARDNVSVGASGGRSLKLAPKTCILFRPSCI